MPRPSRSGIRGLYFDDDGRARIDLRYVDAQGTPHRHKEVFPEGTTARAAKERASQVLAASVTRTLIPRAAPSPAGVVRLSQAFDEYLEWLKVNRPKSWLRAKSVRAVMIGTHGDVRVDALDRRLLEKHKAARLAKTAKPRTVNKDLHVVQRMAVVAVKNGWTWMTEARALDLAKVDHLKGAPVRKRPITDEETARIIAAFTSPRLRFAGRVTVAALLSGMRMGEILGLRKNETGRVLDLSRTKQNRLHQIPISEELRALIAEALADKKRPAGDGPIFVNRVGAAYTVDGFSKLFARVMDRIGLPDVTFHGLRSHVGTLLVNAGERLEVVSKLLGHSSIAVTERHYAHLATEATTAATVRLGRIVAPALVTPPSRSPGQARAGRRATPPGKTSRGTRRASPRAR